MPTLPQRRNAAYLNHQIQRFGALDRGLDGQALSRRTGLAIDLGARSSNVSDPARMALPTWTSCSLDAPLDRRAKTEPLFILDLCVLTVSRPQKCGLTKERKCGITHETPVIP